MKTRFVVTAAKVEAPRPIIGVDGPVVGADLCFDHHVTGERVNLLAIPETVPVPATIATTMLDTDAVISAAVVLLRARGEGASARKVWGVIHEAAHFCDHLVASGDFPQDEERGLGLHGWLKGRGLLRVAVLAWAGSEIGHRRDGTPRPAPSEATRSTVFGELTLALVSAIRLRALPSDWTYLDRLATMEADVRRALRGVRGRVTLLEPDAYIDPMAIYRIVETDLMLLMGSSPDGTRRYSLGVHPRAYERVDVRSALRMLDAREAGWGGRSNCGGSPAGGSRLSPDDVVQAVEKACRS